MFLIIMHILQEYQKIDMPILVNQTRVTRCLTTDDGNHVHLVKVVSAMFLHHKVTVFFLFIIDTYLWGDNFKIMFLLKLLLTNLSMLKCFAVRNLVTVMLYYCRPLSIMTHLKHYSLNC